MRALRGRGGCEDMDSDEQAFFADVPLTPYVSPSLSPCHSPTPSFSRQFPSLSPCHSRTPSFSRPSPSLHPRRSPTRHLSHSPSLSPCRSPTRSLSHSPSRSPGHSLSPSSSHSPSRSPSRSQARSSSSPYNSRTSSEGARALWQRHRTDGGRSWAMPFTEQEQRVHQRPQATPWDPREQQQSSPYRPRGGDCMLPPPGRCAFPLRLRSSALKSTSHHIPHQSPQPPTTHDKSLKYRYHPLEEWNPPLPNPYFTESQRQPHPLQRKFKGACTEEERADLHNRLGDFRRRLFDEREEDEEAEEGERWAAGECLVAGRSAPTWTAEAEGQTEPRSSVPSDPGIGTASSEVTLSTAQARRRFAPSWAFIAWELEPNFLDECVDYYFTHRRWPEPSKLPAWLRRACRVNKQPLTQLYANEPFAPVYMFLLKEMDEEWFRWAIDFFFAEGCWPDFERFPAFLLKACEKMAIGPNNYYNI